ncbi:Molybdopterin-binding domain of aldehyde dehydrogenase [compost metagenome]
MYATPNMLARHSIIPVNTVNPGWMRAPGENISSFALETAMDELAYVVNLDPIELRLRNWAATDPKASIPWTTRSLSGRGQRLRLVDALAQTPFDARGSGADRLGYGCWHLSGVAYTGRGQDHHSQGWSDWLLSEHGRFHAT